MTGIARAKSYFFLGIVLLFSLSCAGSERQSKIKLPEKNLIAVSVYGEREFADYRVYFRGWEADTPQAIFLTDQEKKITYGYAYVLPKELVDDIWGKDAAVLYHFTPQLDGYINIDEKTTALFLVIMSPPYFWMFTPKALVLTAGHIIQHPDFPKLYGEIAKVEPGELLSEKSLKIFALASKIAEDVRESLLPARATPRLHQSDENQCGNAQIARVEDLPGLAFNFVAKNMVFYGGAVFNSDDPGKYQDINKFFTLKAQNGKVDLSLSGILSFNIIDPAVKTTVSVPTDGRHAVRLEKGVELNLSIFTDPVKRIGLVANFGRTVKYVIEIAVPNIAVCIPDGDTWGAVVATAQNLLTTGELSSIKDIFVSGWDEILRIVVTQFMDQNSWIYRVMNKIGFASCSYDGNFIVNQIASMIRWFPLAKLYDAFTKYIPFGIELFKKPRTGLYLVWNGAPLFADEVMIYSVYPDKASSPGQISVVTLGGAGCTSSDSICFLRLYCPSYGTTEFYDTFNCGDRKVIQIPPNFYGDCTLMSIAKKKKQQGFGINLGFFKIGNTYSEWVEYIVSNVSIPIQKCTSSCGEFYDLLQGGGKPPQQEGGGCSTAQPHSVYHIFAIFIIFLLRKVRIRNERLQTD